MTPAQEAKEYAAAHNIHLYPFGRRYRIISNDDPTTLIADVGGYPAALNAMRRWVEANAKDIVVAAVEGCGTVKIERGVLDRAIVAGADAHIVPVAQCKGENCTSNGAAPHSPECIREHDRVTGAVPDECAATGESCSYGPHGRRGEIQCKYCGAAKAPDFDDFNDASKTPIRDAIIAQLRHRKPWNLVIDGVDMGNFASRADAVQHLRKVRNAAIRAGEQFNAVATIERI